MALVAGIDSSTQACKVVVRDADSGDLVRQGRAAHPDGTEVDPARWWAAAQEAIEAAGGLEDVAAVAVGAQQHGLVCLDSAGDVVRPALLWNDTRSASSAADLVDELGGGQAWADAVGVVPVAAVTAAKLRWVADHEPDAADRTAAGALQQIARTLADALADALAERAITVNCVNPGTADTPAGPPRTRRPSSPDTCRAAAYTPRTRPPTSSRSSSPPKPPPSPARSSMPRAAFAASPHDTHRLRPPSWRGSATRPCSASAERARVQGTAR